MTSVGWQGLGQVYTHPSRPRMRGVTFPSRLWQAVQRHHHPVSHRVSFGMMWISATLEGTVTKGTFVSNPSKELQSFGTTTCLMGKVRAYGQVKGFPEGPDLSRLLPCRAVSVLQMAFCHNQ